jgi:short-subunit dehydrogenase involved in D-alanine esterification of teichoic acids
LSDSFSLNTDLDSNSPERNFIMKMTGNTIFMTGGTSGIGLALAQRFARLGNTVIVSGRRADLLEKITAENPRVEGIVLDVQDPASIHSAFEQITARHPEVNVVINLAGIMLPENLRDPEHLPVAEATVTTNLLGPIRVLNEFVPFLLNQKDAAILNVTSGVGFVPLAATPTYSATKGALHLYTDALRAQLHDTDIQVIEIVPPGVRTTLMNQENSERSMPLDEFADETIALLTKEPTANEILVERVKFLRFAERDGKYEEVLAAMSGH